MAEIFGVEKLLSCLPRKKFGQFRFFGMSQFGWSQFGDAEIYIITKKIAPIEYFSDKDGNPVDFAGIYRTDNVSGYTRYYREPYYITKNPRTDLQQANRQKFADAMTAWQALTPEEKLVYTIKAHRKKMWGRNLFLKEYLLSH